MSATRTYSAINVNGLAIGRQSVRLGRVYGIYYTSSTDSPAWLGFYTTSLSSTSATLGQAVAPTTTVTVPVVEFQLTKNTEFMELFDIAMSLIPGPVYCAISSTVGVFTTAGVADAMDIFVEVDEWEIEPPSLTTVHQAGASANHLQIWADTLAAPSSANALYDVLVNDLGNNAGAQLYLQLFADNYANIVAGDTPLRVWSIPIHGNAGVNINLTSTLLLNFGDSQKGGYRPMQQGGTLGSGENTGTNTSACTFVISTSPTTFVAGAATSCLIAARYCTPTL